MVDIEELLSIYWRMKVKKITVFGPVWKVTTTQGDFCLKRCKHGLSHLLFVYYIIEYLWENGYRRTIRLLPTYTGAPFVQTPVGLFTLMRWVGRPLRDNSTTERVLATKELAKFHLVSKNIQLPPRVEKFYFSGKWVRRFPRRIQEMSEAFSTFAKPRNEFEEVVKKKSTMILDSAEVANKILQKSEYKLMVQEIYSRPTLCHGNVKAKNFTIMDDGSVFIIDYDSFRFDVPIQDLSNLFTEVLSSTNWSLSFAQQLFEVYNGVRQIQPEEIPILQSLLIFPYDLYKIIHKYMNGESSPDVALRKWRKAIPRFIQQQQFYEKWFS